jgi:hypothetical protein
MPATSRIAATLARRLLAPVAAALVLCTAAGTLAAQGHAGHHAPAAAAKTGDSTARHREGEAHHALPWKALDAYHTVMAASWHPAKDRNDLAPFRTKAGDFVAAAKALTMEPVPAACGGPAKAAQVEALVRTSEEAAKMAARRDVTDDALKAALRAAHDRFHAVEEGCGAKH